MERDGHFRNAVATVKAAHVLHNMMVDHNPSIGTTSMNEDDVMMMNPPTFSLSIVTRPIQ